MAAHSLENGVFHRQRSMVGYSPWGHKWSDMTEQVTLSVSLSHIYIYVYMYVSMYVCYIYVCVYIYLNHFAIQLKLTQCYKSTICCGCGSVTKSGLTLWPHGLQHPRLPCLPRSCSNSCPLDQLCHPAVSSSAAPFSFCPPSFPAFIFYSFASVRF